MIIIQREWIRCKRIAMITRVFLVPLLNESYKQYENIRFSNLNDVWTKMISTFYFIFLFIKKFLLLLLLFFFFFFLCVVFFYFIFFSLLCFFPLLILHLICLHGRCDERWKILLFHFFCHKIMKWPWLSHSLSIL